MQVSFNAKEAINKGIDFSGIDTAMVGKPSKDSTTKKWDEIILPPDAVANGAFKGNRAIRVTSLGAATPCTLGDFVRQTTNGNYIVKVTLDKLPDAVKAARKAVADQQKVDYKANGPKARTTTATVAPMVPVVPGQAPKVTDTATPKVDQLSEVEALKAQLAIALAALKSAPTATVPTGNIAPKVPAKK